VCLVDNTPAPGYKAEHGISFFLESHCLRLLFDTGQSGDVLLENADAADLDFGWLGMIVLSHGHYDHTGGLMKALGRSGIVKLLAHEDAFDRKVKIEDGRQKDIGVPFTIKELWHYCDPMLKREPFMLCDTIWTTGEIPRVSAFEKPDDRLLVENKGALMVDPVKDDQSLVITTGDGLMLICGCCHSGIVNTLEHVKKTFGRYPATIVGGLHMENASEDRIARTVEAFSAAGVKKLIPGHCSGKKIAAAAAEAGIEVIPLHAGMQLI
jgi:7,8-dihydropterin-6-yl-methyl-4-(beta-D-ribofuranosyl)aminobenzene 5'-phosphate synthase